MQESQLNLIRADAEVRPQSAMMTLVTTAYYQPVESSATSVVSRGTAPMGVSGEETLTRKLKLPTENPVVLGALALWLQSGICGVIITNANDAGNVYYSLLGSTAKLIIPPRLHTVLFVEDDSQVVLWGSTANLNCELTFLPK